MQPIGTSTRFQVARDQIWLPAMMGQAQQFAVERSNYARLLRQWAAVQPDPAARRLLIRLADAQDRSVDVLLDLPPARSPEHTLH